MKRPGDRVPAERRYIELTVCCPQCGAREAVQADERIGARFGGALRQYCRSCDDEMAAELMLGGRRIA